MGQRQVKGRSGSEIISNNKAWPLNSTVSYLYRATSEEDKVKPENAKYPYPYRIITTRSQFRALKKGNYKKL